VFVEDIDGSTSSGDDDDVTKMLDAFDGITAKGGELMIAMTTNHVERIHKGMLRPGRLDGVIHIAELDAAGIEKLIKVVTPKGKLAAKIDFKQVTDAMENFLPAFVRETITRSVSYAIDRNSQDGGEKGNYSISTEDLVHAANGLRPQLDLQDAASEGKRSPKLEGILGKLIDERLQSHNVVGIVDRPGYIEQIPEEILEQRAAARA
jgi:transitional endoplasmic reticulum ATPase